MLAALPIAAQNTPLLMVLAAAILVVFIVFAFVFLSFGRLWLKALTAGAPIMLVDLVGMRLRTIKPSVIVDAYVRLRQAGVDVNHEALQAHYLAGGSVPRIADWLVAAKNAGVEGDIERIAAADLARQLPDVDSVSEYDRNRIQANLRDAARD